MLRYAISDGGFALGLESRSRLFAQAEFLAARRVDFLLLREPSLTAGQLAALARQLLPVLATGPTRLLLHSRPDIAVAVSASGVHLPSTPGALTPHQIRTVFTDSRCPSPIVSVSCHTREDLLRARDIEPELILFGPVFGKQVGGIPVHPGTGLDALRGACLIAAPIPVLALGGVTEENTPYCGGVGAAGVAGIRLFQP